jgi:hypothetical protein
MPGRRGERKPIWGIQERRAGHAFGDVFLEFAMSDHKAVESVSNQVSPFDGALRIEQQRHEAQSSTLSLVPNH